MRRHAFRLRMIVACGAWLALHGGQSLADSRVVVVELFTSQGCSSCPAADKLLGELSKDPTLLPISLSVDYWDYLGWKDTLALPGHAKRQRAYAGMRGDRAVYTPQIVLNGAMLVHGSNREAVESALNQARPKGEAPLPVKVAVADGQVRVEVPAADRSGHAGEVWLCPLSRQVPVLVGRGENRGKTITYSNVVRGWMKLGDWSGEPRSFSKPVADILSVGAGIDAVAILVQNGKAHAPGRVYGAAITSLH